MTGDIDLARDPIAQAQERLSRALEALALRHLDASVHHLHAVEELARYARYVIEPNQRDRTEAT